MDAQSIEISSEPHGRSPKGLWIFGQIRQRKANKTMGKHAQLVIGPAGSGKSTYCDVIQRHCENNKRVVHVVNLDPAAETLGYKPSIDIRELISVEEVMEELDYGPNGALVYCMEFLLENIDWLEEQVADFNDDYLLFDCPGQIELYSHLPVMKDVARSIGKLGYNIAAVFLVDCWSITDVARFVSASLMCLSAMVQLELPHINVLSKCDLVQSKKQLAQFTDPDLVDVLTKLNASMAGKFGQLNQSLVSLLDEYSLVSFVDLDCTEEDSIAYALSCVDHAIQYGEDLEPKEKAEDVVDDPDDVAFAQKLAQLSKSSAAGGGLPTVEEKKDD